MQLYPNVRISLFLLFKALIFIFRRILNIIRSIKYTINRVYINWTRASQIADAPPRLTSWEIYHILLENEIPTTSMKPVEGDSCNESRVVCCFHGVVLILLKLFESECS